MRVELPGIGTGVVSRITTLLAADGVVRTFFLVLREDASFDTWDSARCRLLPGSPIPILPVPPGGRS